MRLKLIKFPQMSLWLLVLIISCLLVFYNYIGYVLPVYIWNRLQKPSDPALLLRPKDWPTVSFIVAAYNEKDCIREKILNSLDQDYPADKLEFIFISDGSTDETPQIAAGYSRIRALHEPERRGKS